MRRLSTAGGVLVVVASLSLPACGSSSHSASSPSTSRPAASESSAPSTTAPRTTTTLDPAAGAAVAQFALTASLNAAKSIYDRTYDYTAVSPESLGPLVPTLKYAPIDQASTGVVGVLAQDKNDVLLVTKSASGPWYCITENDEDGVSYGVARSLSQVNSNGECQLDAWPPTPAAG
jgi:hypothetical protein